MSGFHHALRAFAVIGLACLSTIGLRAEERLDLSRAGVLVSDLDAALALYEQALGMQRVPYRDPLTSPGLTALLGREEIKPVAIVVLESDDGKRLALMHVEGDKARSIAANRMSFGQASLLFSTNRLMELHEKLLALDVTIVREPQDVPPGQPNALYAVDRDGVRLIVTQNIAAPADQDAGRIAQDIAPVGPPGKIPMSLDEIENCDAPVLMVVHGDISELGFQPRPNGRSYGQALRESGLYKRYGGFYLMSGAPVEAFENPYPARRMTLIAQFPCREAAQGFYYSVAYQNIIPLRDGAGTFQFGIWPLRGIEEMYYMREED